MPRTTESTCAIETSLGTMVVELYDETPQHRDNFLKLVEEGFYEDLLWHRVISGLWHKGETPIQGRRSRSPLGQGGPGIPLTAEIDPQFIHDKGALAAARQGDQVNPSARSSGSQFYIVQGRDVSRRSLQGSREQQTEAVMRQPFSYTPDQIAAYRSSGAPHIWTCSTRSLAAVIEGMDVLDAICALQVERSRSRPLEDIYHGDENPQLTRMSTLNQAELDRLLAEAQNADVLDIPMRSKLFASRISDGKGFSRTSTSVSVPFPDPEKREMGQAINAFKQALQAHFDQAKGRPDGRGRRPIQRSRPYPSKRRGASGLSPPHSHRAA